MKGTIKKASIAAIIAGVFGFMVYCLAKDWETLIAMDWAGHPGLLATHALAMIAVQGLFALGWFVVLRRLDVSWGLNRAAATLLAANLGKYVPGKVVLLVGRIELCRHYGMSRTESLHAMILEHILSVFGAVPFPSSSW